MHHVLTGFIFSLSTLLLVACNTNENNENTTARSAVSSAEKTLVTDKQTASRHKWATLIDAQTQGKVSRYTPIYIRFRQPVIEISQIGKTASGILQIQPAVKGTAIFENTQQITLVPDTPLQASQRYTVTLQPNGLQGMTPTDAPYTFSFSTIPLEYELQTDALQVDPNNASLMRLSGSVLFSDRVEMDAVSKLLTATLQDKPLPVRWQMDDSGKQFRFYLESLPRETYATDLLLSWNGTSLGIDTQGKTTVTLPAINTFKVLDIRRITPLADKPYIRITLSAIRDQEQNLKGLIRLEPIPDIEHPNPKTVPFKLSSEGNLIKLFPREGASGRFNVAIEPGLRGKNGNALGKRINQTIELETIKPGIRFVGKGHILPDSKILEIPFEAANVDAVKVKAFLINPDNVAQFFQVNTLQDNSELQRVGRYLWQKTIPLSAANFAQWNRYTLDASELLRSHPGGLFHLELSIDRRYSRYHCPAGTPKTLAADQPLQNHEDNDVVEASGWDGVETLTESAEQLLNDWRWEDRNKPCTDAYFQFDDNPVADSRNFIASNIGLLAKQDAHGKLLIVATDLKTSTPLPAVDLRVQNFQYQTLATATTNDEGMATVSLEKTPFLLIASKNKEKAYLKLNGSTALPVSHFDVGGSQLKEGLNGTIYGERGVWRPGDTIYLTFVLQDKDKVIPANHPVSMQLYDPKGRLVQSLTNTTPTGNFYTFALQTDENAETGKWLAKARLGNTTFSKTLTIETVRPNRLKIDLDFGTDVLLGYEPPPQGKLFAQWLHGATASGLKADIAVRFREKTTRFERFANYQFDDPARSLDSSEQKLLEGRLDETGTLRFKKAFAPQSRAPGMLSAWFTSRVFEQGGGFSISKHYLDYHPYAHYVGIKLPKGDASRNMLLTDQTHRVEIASLTASGEPADLQRVQVTLYKVDWKWWWDKSPESLAAYSNANHRRKLQQSIIQTHQGRGYWDFAIKYPDWGRYLIRACDLEGKHCAGQTVYIDWPGWAGRAQQQGSSAAATLDLFSDKKSYQVGETAIVQLPRASRGRALVSVESGSDIISQQWVEFNEQRQQVEIPIKETMAPNVYVSVSLLQPHANKQNDRPIRMLGIIPLQVTDPNTRLNPMMTAADEWKPSSTHSVVVAEANGKPMNYTLALVDEGLLGLTRFKTPDLHAFFYRKQALGIKHWDLFDDVVGAYGGKLERLLALGGGDDVQLDDAANRPKRFPPVVQFLGPFQLQKGATRTHEFNLPAYLGAVRVMLVAGHENAYGQAEKSIFVRQPLMIQPNLPRVLSTREEVIVPVTLFTTREDIKEVVVTVKTDELLQAENPQTRVVFEKTGDKLAFVRIRAGTKPGQSTLRFTARSHQYQSEAEIHLDIRRPATLTTRTETHTINAGETGRYPVTAYGIEGTNRALLELSSAPPLGLEKQLDYLVTYPHGCLEQTTSAAFPQIFLNRLIQTDPQREKRIEQHVNKAIERIRSYQLANGDFSYWPGMNEQNNWASLYAGHFLLEAKQAGYLVSPTLLTDWLRYQATTAQRWLAGSKEYAYTQAYRLYLLALAGKPELGAMNRFRENSQPGLKAKWLLAAAYQLAGQQDAARQSLEGLVANPQATTIQHPDTFSSRLSDLGLQLTALTTLGKYQDADHFVNAIAQELQQPNQNTHGIAWALIAVSRYISSAQNTDKNADVRAELAWGEDPQIPVSGKKAYLRHVLGELTQTSQELIIKNPSSVPLYANIITQGVPEAGHEVAVANGLKMTVNYYTAENKQPLDLSAPLPQGKDILITLDVHNISGQTLENIALTQLLPSGMEITQANSSSDTLDYLDIRDNRVNFYFSLEDKESKHFQVTLNPAYAGRFYLPAVSAAAMYQPALQARVAGQWIHISANN